MKAFPELSGGDHGRLYQDGTTQRPTKLHLYSASLLGVHRAVVPPDPFSNSEVKRSIADGSVGSPHVRVGQRQAPIPKCRTASTVRHFHFSNVLRNG